MDTIILQSLFSGLSSGGMYALLAIGISLIYSSTKIINFAQGEFVMLGGMIMVFLFGDIRLPLFFAFFLTVLIVSIIGALLKFVVYRPGKEIPLVTILIITLGISFFISGVAMHVWDKDLHIYPSFSGEDPFIVLGASILPQSLWVIVISIIVFAVLGLFFNLSIHGKAMKACAIDPIAASLMGIKVNKMVLLSFILSSALGAVAGIVITPITMMEYSGGMLMALKGFSAALFGGMGSIVGAVLGGILIGLFESLAATFLSSGYKDLITFLLIINILLFRPRGLMGSKLPEGLED